MKLWSNFYLTLLWMKTSLLTDKLINLGNSTFYLFDVMATKCHKASPGLIHYFPFNLVDTSISIFFSDPQNLILPKQNLYFSRLR